jgi:para-aminobenzoate synthetase/4-amino-4-deoxychorismate lyase
MSPAPAAMSAVLAAHPIDTEDVFLYHKTTRRAVYESALAGRGTDEVDPPDEVILYNDRGELTECTIGNIVLEVAGRRLTPPVGSGLLPGTFREELLESGQIEEAIVHQDDLAGADAVYMINSLRRWVRLDPGHAKIEANESMEERESCTG